MFVCLCDCVPLSESPVLSQLTETLRVNEGGSVTFECPYTNATSITWLKDGVVVEMENTSTLTLAEVDRTLHNTSYSCVATTPTNTTERMNFQLLVNCESPPSPSPGPVIEGTPFAMG